MKVVIVECREALEGRFDGDLAHVASSWEAAIAWVKDNPGWCKAPLWWWVGYEHQVDGDGMVGVPRFFDQAGVELRGQPAPVPLDRS